MKNLFLKYKNDIILVVALLLAAATAFVLLPLFKKEGAYAVVSVDGEEVARFSLEENEEMKFDTPNGYNVVKIEGGKAFVIDADCKDLICKNSRPISAVGETVVCLPHKLVVSIEGGEDEIIN